VGAIPPAPVFLREDSRQIRMNFMADSRTVKETSLDAIGLVTSFVMMDTLGALRTEGANWQSRQAPDAEITSDCA
jgi:hypothetical protein